MGQYVAMRKIFKRGNTWYLDEYFAYLETKKDEIPKEIKEFILDRNRYRLDPEETLHDAWLTKLKFQLNIYRGDDKLLMEFLGPYHDRIFKFVFSGVVNVQIKGDNQDFKESDLLMHQFSFNSKNQYLYIFVFSGGKQITITFTKLEINEILL